VFRKTPERYVRCVRRGLALAFVVALCGCTVNDPTENTVGLRVTNDLGVAARFGVCASHDCRSRRYVDRSDEVMSPGESSDWNADSDPTVINPFRIEVADAKDRCLFVRYRRLKADASIRLSAARACDQPERIMVVPCVGCASVAV
jgi:hypothetical protein